MLLIYFCLIDIVSASKVKRGERLFREEPSGSRGTPHPDGTLGVVKKGVFANLLVVDGNPLEEIPVLHVYRNNLKLIMQNGKILKNTLVPAGDPGNCPVIGTIVTN
jgi:hypothetical protein